MASLREHNTAPVQAATESVSSLASKLSESNMLDLAFVMDATGSMGSYIAAAQQSIRAMIETIVSAEKADVQFALTSYRDHPPQDSSYVTRSFEFTKSVAAMRKNLDTLSANGGGDGPEAVVDGLHDALKLPFRVDATKVVVLIADAPPHGLQPSGDGFPDGCPCGLDPIQVCRDLAQKGITLYCIGCEPSINPYRPFFQARAHITGGQYCPLSSASILSDVIVGGVREEMGLEKLMDDVQAEVSAVDGLSDEQQAQHVWQKMRERKVVTKQLRMGAASIPTPSDDAILMSKATSLTEARKTYKPEAHTAMFAGAMPRSSRAVPTSKGMPVADPSYHLAEAEDISLEQCSRMVMKSKARSGK